MEQGRYVGYFEAHIEQGPWLEHTGNHIGVCALQMMTFALQMMNFAFILMNLQVVTGCVGIDGVTVDFIGKQNHAGTTPVRKKMMNFGLKKTRNCALRTRNCVIKTKNCVFKMMNLSDAPAC